jgi:hypothetical protein
MFPQFLYTSLFTFAFSTVLGADSLSHAVGFFEEENEDPPEPKEPVLKSLTVGPVTAQAKGGEDIVLGPPPLQVAQFDPALGSLQSLRVTYSISGSLDWVATNVSENPISLPALGIQFETSLSSSLPGLNPFMKNGSASRVNLSIPPGESRRARANLENSRSALLLQPSSLDAATGYSTISFAPEISYTGFWGLPSPDFSDWNRKIEIDATYSLSIEYSFIPVPEPSAAGLLIGALGFAASAIRFLRKKRNPSTPLSSEVRSSSAPS